MDPWEAYARHVNPVLGDFLRLTGRDLRFVRAQGSQMVDAEGRRYDDWVAGFGSLNLGHNPPELKSEILAHLEENTPNLYVENLNPHAGALAARLVELAGPPFKTVFLCNSGAEAVEACLKTAMLATGRHRIVHLDGAYHGTTLGALACMGRGPYREPFEGVLTSSREVPFGHLAAAEQALAPDDVAAFILEPIQVEAGLRIAPIEYLRGLRELCRAHRTLLVFDEVQTGMGRTGTLFAWQHSEVAPDLFALAKSLGGGLVPVGAAVMAEGLWRRAYGGYLRCEIHNSTFGGNALGAKVALKALETVADPTFLDGVRARGKRLFGSLERALAGSRAVEAISWRGLLGGIRFRTPTHPSLRWENMGLPELEGQGIAGPLAVERLLRRCILTQVCAHNWSVLRVEPPLTVDEGAIARFVDAIGDAARWLEEHA